MAELNSSSFKPLREAMKDPAYLEMLKKQFDEVSLKDTMNLGIKRIGYVPPSTGIPVDSPIVQELERMKEILKEQREEKERVEAIKEQREIDNHKHLKNISKNTDYIVKQFKDTAMNLERLNKMLEKMNLTLDDIRKDVEESKAVEFEIFELLGKENIANEKGRLEATETLLNKFKDPVNFVDVSANIMSIIDIIINSIK